MKYSAVLLGLFCVGTSAWAVPVEYSFVSTLSAPVASFKEVETVDSNPVLVGEGTEVNIGSASATVGKVTFKGKPLDITTLYMEDGTTFQVANEKTWTVNQLKIGQGGVVVPKHITKASLNLHANNPQTHILKAETVTIEGNVSATEVKANALNIKNGENTSFAFAGGGDDVTGKTAEFKDDGVQNRTNTEIQADHTPSVGNTSVTSLAVLRAN